MEQFMVEHWPSLTLLALWSLAWKGAALWKASRLNQPWWFVIMLVVNTVGLLEILYLFVFSALGKTKKS